MPRNVNLGKSGAAADSAPLLTGGCQLFAIVEALVEVAVADAPGALGTRILPEALRRPLDQLRIRKMLMLCRQSGASRAWLVGRLRIHATEEPGLLAPACVTPQGNYCCRGACLAGKSALAMQGELL